MLRTCEVRGGVVMVSSADGIGVRAVAASDSTACVGGWFSWAASLHAVSPGTIVASQRHIHHIPRIITAMRYIRHTPFPVSY